MQPRTLGRYRIIEELGRGNMGRIYLAHDPGIDRQVAIKTVRSLAEIPEQQRQEARERFLREARSIGRLQHPGIVTVFDVGAAGDQLYLAMELVDGTSLDKFCQPGNLLPVKTVVEMIAGIAEALDYAHRQGIIHRDIKPANLMRVGDQQAKIMDFGLARPSEAQLTQDGTLLGTPSYMSPEQIRDSKIDGRSDLFSLAVVLFELLTGERPTKGESVSAIIYGIVNEPPPPACEVSPRVSRRLNDMLQRALSKKRDERFPTGTEFAKALRAAVNGQSPEPAEEEQPCVPLPIPEEEGEFVPAPAAVPRSSPMPFVIGLVMIIILVAAAAYYYRDRMGLFEDAEPAPAWGVTKVRSEPPGLVISLDGIPLDPSTGNLLQLRPEGPFGLLTAQLDCRLAEHQLEPADAGGEVVLVIDPVKLSWPVDLAVEGLQIRLNEEQLGAAPLDLDLDLCRENRIDLEAPGYRLESLQIAAGALPLEARTLLSSVSLRPIPKGKVMLPESALSLAYYLDGNRVDRTDEAIVLYEGEHTLRVTNSQYWIDVTERFTLKRDETITPDLDVPSLTTLVVQAFPANCEVYLRRGAGKWRFVDETPMRAQLAVGRYQLRVKLKPTGETRDQEINLVPGENPPVRVSFGRS